MARTGGARKGAGRPRGSVQKLTARSREEAKEMGLLPHEWLLMIARGEAIEQKRWDVKFYANGREKSRELVTEMIYPDLAMRQDSAKAAAPYYAPKLATQLVELSGPGGKPIQTEDATAGSRDELKKKLSAFVKVT